MAKPSYFMAFMPCNPSCRRRYRWVDTLYSRRVKTRWYHGSQHHRACPNLRDCSDIQISANRQTALAWQKVAERIKAWYCPPCWTPDDGRIQCQLTNIRRAKPPLLLVLDQITDPNNLARVCVPPWQWVSQPSHSQNIVKHYPSRGNCRRRCGGINSFILSHWLATHWTSKKTRCLCLVRYSDDAAKPVQDCWFDRWCAIVGSEGDGTPFDRRYLRPSWADIPMPGNEHGQIQSLNVSAALAWCCTWSQSPAR